MLNATSETSTSSQSTISSLISASSSTTDDNEYSTPTDYVFLIYYYGLLCLLSVINLTGNALVIQCLVRHRHLRVPGNYFIFSLAFSDLCLGLTYPVYNVSHMEIARVSQALDSYSGVCRYERFLNYSHIILTCILSVIAPLVLMTILYGVMAHEARKHVISIAYACGPLLGDHIGARRYIIRKEVRMVAMAGTLLGYFAFSWLPFVVYQFYTIRFCNADNWTECEPNKYIRATVRLLLHSNSAVNFFIYSIRAKDFREALQKDLASIRCYRQRDRGAGFNGGDPFPPRFPVDIHTLQHVGDKQLRNTSLLGSMLSERTIYMETLLKSRSGTSLRTVENGNRC